MHKGITREETLLSVLRGKYASQFAKRFGDMKPEVVDMVFKGALVGIDDEQFNEGMARLLAPGNKFMPDLAEFQSWCVSGSWWSVDEAWANACSFTNDRAVRITTLTKYALDQVMHQITMGDMKAAERRFKELYLALLAKAQTMGRKQEWYVPPKQLECKSKAADEPAKVEQVALNTEQEQIVQLSAKYRAQGLSFKAALEKAETEIRGYVKPLFKQVAV